jgi:hypothetical protein
MFLIPIPIMTQQHYRITLENAIAHYQAGDLTAKGLIHFYLKIKLKPGWKRRLNHKEVCKELGIQKTAFYNAISRLKAEGSIDWEAPEGILVSISNTFRECGNDSAIAESQFANAEPDSAIADWLSANAESKSPKPASNNHCGDPPDFLTDSYQIFINSLSESERENFFSFVKEKIKNLSQPINDLEAWLASKNQAGQNRWEIYYNNFLVEKQNQLARSSMRRNSQTPEFKKSVAEFRQRHLEDLEGRRIAAEQQSSEEPTDKKAVQEKLAELLNSKPTPPPKKKEKTEEYKQWRREVELRERQRIDALFKEFEGGSQS